MEILGKRMKEVRKEKNLRQSDVADILGVALISYQRYEAGERELTAPVLADFAKYFGVSTDYLLGLTDQR